MRIDQLGLPNITKDGQCSLSTPPSLVELDLPARDNVEHNHCGSRRVAS